MIPYRLRKLVSLLMMGGTAMATLGGLLPLFLILSDLVRRGIGSVNFAFFTQTPVPVGEVGGGMANAIVGSAYMIAVACVLALPVGLLGGLYLAEYGQNRLGAFIRFMADMLSGLPSIVVGIFIYSVVVVPMGRFSGLAGGLSLGIIMMPMVMRQTEEMLKLVPHSLREASLALGVPYWKTLFRVIFVTARSGILTGILLSIARVAGETAPLLFTALGNQFWNLKLDQPMAALPLQVFTYAISPFEDWQRQAWAGALVLMGLVMLLNLTSRFAMKRRLLKQS